MSSLPKTEGYVGYLPHVKCYRWFCFRKPIFRKMVIKFPVIPEYLSACEKHQ